jgi:hypothetical protein
MGLEVDGCLRRKYEGQIAGIAIVEKEDIDLVSLLLFFSHAFNYLFQLGSICCCDCSNLVLFRAYCSAFSFC